MLKNTKCIVLLFCIALMFYVFNSIYREGAGRRLRQLQRGAERHQKTGEELQSEKNTNATADERDLANQSRWGALKANVGKAAEDASKKRAEEAKFNEIFDENEREIDQTRAAAPTALAAAAKLAGGARPRMTAARSPRTPPSRTPPPREAVEDPTSAGSDWVKHELEFHSVEDFSNFGSVY